MSESQFPSQLGVELIESASVQKRHYRGVERQVLVDDPPRVVGVGGPDERVEGLADRSKLIRFLGDT